MRHFGPRGACRQCRSSTTYLGRLVEHREADPPPRDDAVRHVREEVGPVDPDPSLLLRMFRSRLDEAGELALGLGAESDGDGVEA